MEEMLVVANLINLQSAEWYTVVTSLKVHCTRSESMVGEHDLGGSTNQAS